MHKDSIKPKEKVIIVDDLIATGGTAVAGAKLVEKSKGIISGFVFVINLFDLGGIELLKKKEYKAFSLINFPGH
jgi:adenine phosphoribosyltransferase